MSHKNKTKLNDEDEQQQQQQQQQQLSKKRSLRLLQRMLCHDDSFQFAHELSAIFGHPDSRDYASTMLDLYSSIDKEKLFLHRFLELELEQLSPLEPRYLVLFRSNTACTYMFASYLKRIGANYLRNAILPVVRNIMSSPHCVEIHPNKLSERFDCGCCEAGENAEVRKDRHMKHVIDLIEPTVTAIFSSIDYVPIEARELMSFLYSEISKKKEEYDLQHEKEKEAEKGKEQSVVDSFRERERRNFLVPEISVAGFFFLRFICPALVSPENYFEEMGVKKTEIKHTPNGPTTVEKIRGILEPVKRRKLVFIAKFLQNLANRITFGCQERFMQPLNPILENHRQGMNDFLLQISTVPSSSSSSSSSSLNDKNQCKICMDADIQVAVIPCGHTYMCLDCSEDLGLQKCAICREDVQTIVRLYFA